MQFHIFSYVSYSTGFYHIIFKLGLIISQYTALAESRILYVPIVLLLSQCINRKKDDRIKNFYEIDSLHFIREHTHVHRKAEFKR